MEIEQKKEGKVVILELVGRFQPENEADLHRTIEDLIRRSSIYLVLNLSGVSSMTSQGLSVIIANKKRLQQIKGNLVLSDLRPTIRELFEFTRLQSVFDLFDTDPEAIAFFNQFSKR